MIWGSGMPGELIRFLNQYAARDLLAAGSHPLLPSFDYSTSEWSGASTVMTPRQKQKRKLAAEELSSNEHERSRKKKKQMIAGLPIALSWSKLAEPREGSGNL